VTQLDHNIDPGPITTCQVCGSENLEPVIDLGHQPLCDTLLAQSQLSQPETYFPLRLFRCIGCSLAQLDYAVEGSVVYHPEYPYRSGVTRELAEHQDSLASDVVQQFSVSENSLVVDIGSNDGTLLSGFRKLGMRTVGVEPTNIAQIARTENRIETLQAFFSESTAEEIVEQHGSATVVTATNVLAHMTALGDVMRGVSALLDEGGVFVSESHYLLEIIKLVQYDTIYHEHLRSYSLRSLVRLFEQFDFSIVDARLVNRYAGSIRVCAVKGRDQRPNRSVSKMLKAEEDFGLYERETYDHFRERSQKAKNDLLRLATKCQDRGELFVANSCPGRGSTLVNYTGITRELMPYICEQPASLKLGLYLPGAHIPVVENCRLIEEQPDYVLLLAWHYADTITKELRARGLRSKLVMPLPEVKVLES